jgi:hypothetical protein
MKKLITLTFSCIVATISLKAQTVPTTTITGNLKVSDSLHVINNISTKGSVSAVGDITATGEVTAKDTMHAQKDVLVDGNVVVGGDMKVAGTTSVSNLNITGSVNFASQPATINPCLQLLMTETSPTNTQHLVSLDAAAIGVIEANLDANPCPTPPVIPFTWQTYGNHVNSNNRWIGTIENFDFNIRTNSTLRMNVKNNGTVNLFTLNSTTTGAFVIKNNDLNKNVFNVQNNGATYIGSENVTNGPHTNALLTVSGSGYWADFVFDKNYKLMSLKEVEAYYVANSHLPNIPTAKDIAIDGNDLAKTDALLLQKIEELTLYIVQQQKEIEALKKEIKK